MVRNYASHSRMRALATSRPRVACETSFLLAIGVRAFSLSFRRVYVHAYTRAERDVVVCTADRTVDGHRPIDGEPLTLDAILQWRPDSQSWLYKPVDHLPPRDKYRAIDRSRDRRRLGRNFDDNLGSLPYNYMDICYDDRTAVLYSSRLRPA